MGKKEYAALKLKAFFFVINFVFQCEQIFQKCLQQMYLRKAVVSMVNWIVRAMVWIEYVTEVKYLLLNFMITLLCIEFWNNFFLTQKLQLHLVDAR